MHARSLQSVRNHYTYASLIIQTLPMQWLLNSHYKYPRDCAASPTSHVFNSLWIRNRLSIRYSHVTPMCPPTAIHHPILVPTLTLGKENRNKPSARPLNHWLHQPGHTHTHTGTCTLNIHYMATPTHPKHLPFLLLPPPSPFPSIWYW